MECNRSAPHSLPFPSSQKGKTPLDVAKDDATKALLRNPPPRQAAPAPAASPASAVPADVATLLTQLSLSAHGPALVDKLGISCTSDLRHVTDAMLKEELPSLKPIERAKLLAAATPAALAPAAAAPPACSCDVMLSYRVPETGDGGDRSVFALQAALKQRGYSVFVGESAIQGGASWPTTIQDAVRHCRAFVILCSPTYGNRDVSPWTFDEITMAKNNRKPLFPVWHSGPYPPPAVEIMLGGLNRIPRGNYKGGYTAALIPHEDVAEELAAALARAGVVPTGALER